MECVWIGLLLTLFKQNEERKREKRSSSNTNDDDDICSLWEIEKKERDGESRARMRREKKNLVMF